MYFCNGDQVLQSREFVVVEKEGPELAKRGEGESLRKRCEFIIGEIDFHEIAVGLHEVKLFECGFVLGKDQHLYTQRLLYRLQAHRVLLRGAHQLRTELQLLIIFLAGTNKLGDHGTTKETDRKQWTIPMIVVGYIINASGR